jgi:hypothetical protein
MPMAAQYRNVTLGQFEMTLTADVRGCLFEVTVALTSDEELSRLEERTAQEAVRPLMLRRGHTSAP